MLDGWFRILAGSYGDIGPVLCNQDLQFQPILESCYKQSFFWGKGGVGREERGRCIVGGIGPVSTPVWVQGLVI